MINEPNFDLLLQTRRIKMEETLMELLDDYYGDSKDQDHKEEICEFIENYCYDIKAIIESEEQKQG